MNVILRTAAQLRKAELTIEPEYTSSDVIEQAIANWALPTDTDYTLVNITKQTTIAPNAALSTSRIEDGDILEIQPVLVAGYDGTNKG